VPRSGAPLMARMGHHSERAELIYQHETQGADRTTTNPIDTHVQAEQARHGNNEDSPTGAMVPAG
jgi:hypothetical protein